MLELTKYFTNLIYPLHCAACKKRLHPLDELGVCEPCVARIRRNPKPHCQRCGRSLDNASMLCAECRRRPFHFDRAHSAYLYEGVLKDLIHLFKYRSRISLSRLLGRLMTDYLKENDDILAGIDVITYVPLSAKRIRVREFNQSKVLALKIAEESGIPVVDVLYKRGHTRPQNELSRDERLVNLSGAFEAKGETAKEKNILLMDDVMTTGATLDECSKTLKKSGAKTVTCLTLARGL